MKKNQLIIALILLFAIGNSAFAQANPKIIAVISKASWCQTCVQNAGRIVKDVLPNVDTNKIQIVANDLSDKKSKEVSAKQLTNLGLNSSDYKTTGVITFVDAKTKKKVASINVAKPSGEILKTFENSLR